MTPVHSHAFREWESDVNDIQSNFEESRETSFKKFIQSIKTKTVFNFKPVGPFMERKRPQESTPKNQNQNQDKRPKVASKKVACSMCKEKKNIESFHPEKNCFWYIKDENGNIVENPEGEAKRKKKEKKRRKILQINLILNQLYYFLTFQIQMTRITSILKNQTSIYLILVQIFLSFENQYQMPYRVTYISIL